MPRRGKKRGAGWSRQDTKRRREAVRRRREKETKQERTKRLEDQRKRMQNRRHEETQQERTQHLEESRNDAKRRREAVRSRREKETQEERTKRLEDQRERARNRRNRETQQERSNRLADQRKRAQNKRNEETQQERIKRLEDQRERTRNRRNDETQQERSKRLEDQRERSRNRRNDETGGERTETLATQQARDPTSQNAQLTMRNLSADVGEMTKVMKKFPCRLCERSFCSAPSLRRHVRVNHEGIKHVYSCRHCTEGKWTFSSRLALEKHLQVIHSINLADHVQDQENLFQRVSIKTSIRKRGGALERWGSDPVKRRRGGGNPPYRCMKCGHTTSSFADFHQHIPQHRTSGSPYQCRQCGLCFAARPSLGRHLFIVHGVKESESAVLAEQAADSDSAQLGDHVICDVCGKTFDNEPLLKTHFRTHGMAFIKSKQNGLDK